jgi:hypothetical protein
VAHVHSGSGLLRIGFHHLPELIEFLFNLVFGRLAEQLGDSMAK